MPPDKSEGVRGVVLPTVDDLKDIQREHCLGDRHVVWIGPSWFVVAHTDEERAVAQGDGCALDKCPLHDWLHGLSDPPCEQGYYTAHRHKPDAYSEPYGADPWEFVPLAESVPLSEQRGPDA